MSKTGAGKGEKSYQPKHRVEPSRDAYFLRGSAQVSYSEEERERELEESLAVEEAVQEEQLEMDEGEEFAQASGGASNPDWATLMRLMQENTIKAMIAAEERREQARLKEEDRREKKRQDEEEKRRKDREDEIAREELARSEREATRRAEERRTRLHDQELKEKLAGFGSFKESGDLGLYIDKFERIMEDCEIARGRRISRLYTKLPEAYCARIQGLVDDGAGYGEVKAALLKSVGHTPALYGQKYFEYTAESFKSMCANQNIEEVYRTLDGLLGGCKTMAEAKFMLARTLMRQVLPYSARVFLESKEMSRRQDLIDNLGDWLTTRAKGNYFLPVGSRPAGRFSKEGGQAPRQGCFRCGKLGHKIFECRKPADYMIPGGGSPNVDQVTSPRERVVTCYGCGQEGHKKPDCPESKKDSKADMNVVSLKIPRSSQNNMIKGKIGSAVVDILVDSGADYIWVSTCKVGPQGLLPREEMSCRWY